MTAAGWVQLGVLIVLIAIGTRVLGPYIAAIFTMPADEVDGDERRAAGTTLHRSAEAEVHAAGTGGEEDDAGAAVALAVDERPPPPRRGIRGDKVFLPVERFIYRLCGIDETREQRWSVYALSLLAFSLVSVILLYVLQRLQGALPLNPNG
ncbi:MAG TPA: potassium-transporting ATPase subunit KdpA, partial [Acidimicrobiales bacterium]|nr:potassium-transporting ATPase subunit KdpA [Acidimicrobiales bacterium]